MPSLFIKSVFLSFSSICFFIIIVSTLPSCVEEVDLPTRKGPPSGRLVIEGEITSEAKAHHVILSRTNDAVVKKAPQVVSEAYVSISDGENEFVLKEIPGSGVYLSDSTLKGEVGKSYTLTVRSEGKTYRGTDKMEPVGPFEERDNLFIFDKYLFGNPQRGFTLEAPLVFFGAEQAVKSRIFFKNPTIAPERKVNAQTEVHYFPGVEADGLIPRTASVFKFQPGDTLIQSRLSMSRGYYLFSRALLLQAKYFGGVLGAVPADLPTNMSEGAIGFFNASAVVSRAIIINKE